MYLIRTYMVHTQSLFELITGRAVRYAMSHKERGKGCPKGEYRNVAREIIKCFGLGHGDEFAVL